MHSAHAKVAPRMTAHLEREGERASTHAVVVACWLSSITASTLALTAPPCTTIISVVVRGGTFAAAHAAVVVARVHWRHSNLTQQRQTSDKLPPVLYWIFIACGRAHDADLDILVIYTASL